MTNSNFKAGDRVVYHPVSGSQETSTGTISKLLTHEETAGQKELRFVIVDNQTHKESIRKFEHIIKMAN
jgi:hypothetical protein